MEDLPEQESWQNDREHMLSKDCAYPSTNRSRVLSQCTLLTKM